MTTHVAELLLTGALDQVEARSSERPEPAQVVDIAVVDYVEPLLPGQVRQPASFTWMHVPTGECGDFPPQDVLALVVRGVGVEITAGVAAAAADVPDDASELTDTTE